MSEVTFYVGIYCDDPACGRQETGDYAASSQAAAEDGLRADLVGRWGWSCDERGDFCPLHKTPAESVATG